MESKRKKFWSDNNRLRLMVLAVVLPAASLIHFNFSHLKSLKRNKVLESAFHGDFQQMLAISEKRINQKVYTMAEEVRDLFPSPDTETQSEKERKLDLILSKSPWVAHVFLFDREKGFLFRSQPQQMRDSYFCEEHERLAKMFSGWFGMDGKMLVDQMHKKNQPYCHGGEVTRAGGYTYMVHAFFCFPQLSKDRVVFGGVSFDPNYLKQTFFPEMLDELIARKLTEEGGNQLDMVVYPTDYEGGAGNGPVLTGAEEPGAFLHGSRLGVLPLGHGDKLLAASAGWREGK